MQTDPAFDEGNLASGTLAGRREQIFPTLTDAEIARITRFGADRRYPAGTRLFTAGEPSSGMFVVLSGTVAISRRDGFGQVVSIGRRGRGQFVGEVSQL